MSGRGRRRAALVGLLLADAAALAFAWRAAYLLRFRWEIGALESVPVAPFSEYMKGLAVLLVLVPLLFRLFGLYRDEGVRAGIDDVHAITKAVSGGAAVVLVVTFFLRTQGFQLSRLSVLYWWALSIALVTLLHALHGRWQLGRFKRGLDLRRALVVGESSGYVVEKLRAEPAFGLDVVGCVRDPGPETATGPAPAGESETLAGEESGRAGVLTRSALVSGRASLAPLARLGAVADLSEVLAQGRVEEAFIVDHALTHRALLEAIDACERHAVEVRLVPPIYDLLVGEGDLTFVEGVPLVRVDETRFRRGSLAAKRVFDLVTSAIALALLSPLFAAISVAIRRGSAGPVFFTQERAGRGGQPFRMVKFRTMVADAEARLPELIDVEKLAQPSFKIDRDPRVTRVGAALRRFSLDELPQLWNVLVGDMSLVGPRPEEARIVARYDVWQRRRLKVKPGITGLQQVLARGTLSDLNERVRLDIFYIRKRSFLFDVIILARTAWVVLSGRGAT